MTKKELAEGVLFCLMFFAFMFVGCLWAAI